MTQRVNAISSGYVKATNFNLPSIDAFTLSIYTRNDSRFTDAELRGWKELRSAKESYGDNAIGYVQVKRERDICRVTARITPEHRVHATTYVVEVVIKTSNNRITGATCNGCAGSKGGCKHVIGFLYWLHRRSEDPSVTELICYWKKSNLSKAGREIKFVTKEDFLKTKNRKSLSENAEEITPVDLDVLAKKAIEIGSKSIFLRHYIDTPCLSLDIHSLVQQYKSSGGINDAAAFILFCKERMSVKR